MAETSSSNGLLEEHQSVLSSSSTRITTSAETHAQNGTQLGAIKKGSTNVEKTVISNGHTTITERKIVQSSISSRTEVKQGPILQRKESRTVTIIENGSAHTPNGHIENNTSYLLDCAPIDVEGKYLNGPNQVIPAESFTTTEVDGRVKLHIRKTGIGATQPLSVPGLMRKTVDEYPEVTALAYKNSDGTWAQYSYEEYQEAVILCAKAFLKLGLKRHHSVCILGFNSPEWFIADLAAIFAGGIACGIYTTNSPEACRYCAEHSRANIIVVQDQKQLDKILQVKEHLPELKAIIQYEGTPQTEGVLSWEDVMKMGKEEEDKALEDVQKTIAVNECCTIVYTSGTVGHPKGVMLTHDNLTWTAHCIGTRFDLAAGEESIISYLPLSHVAAQVVDIYIAMAFGVSIYFADKDALKGSLAKTLQEVRPTHFLGVPRVWEKIAEKMAHIGRQNGQIKKTLASWAKSHGLQHNLDRMNGITTNTFNYMLANMLIFRRVKRLLGFDRCQNFFSTAAPLSNDVKKYLMSLDIPVMEVFGMSESSGPHTISFSDNFRLESTGKTLSGLETKIHNPDEEQEGEICMKGRNIFMGYLGDPEKTREAIDEQGWLHSGDIGKVDKDGFLYITGRIKELIITAGGENIPPVLIEQNVKAELPCVSHAVLIGDKRKFLTMLLTLKTEIQPESGEPLDELSPISKSWCKSVGSVAVSVSEVLKGPDAKIMAAIQKGIDRANLKSISNAQKVQKFVILPKDFSVFTGELGPTMKMKRNVIAKKYAETIERFYQDT